MFSTPQGKPLNPRNVYRHLPPTGRASWHSVRRDGRVSAHDLDHRPQRGEEYARRRADARPRAPGGDGQTVHPAAEDAAERTEASGQALFGT